MQSEPDSGAIEPSLKALAFVLADTATVLAADDLAGYQKQLPTLRASLADYFAADAHAEHGPLGKFKDGLPERDNLKSARADFAPLSTAVTDLMRSRHLHHTAGLHIFECPMAPVIGTGRWLQRDATLKNPFLGSAMGDCGTEIDAPTASIKTAPSIGGHITRRVVTLPPGHPPLDAASLAVLSRALQTTGNSSASAAGCGSCGMSQAAMAAGEPCEHDKK